LFENETNMICWHCFCKKIKYVLTQRYRVI